MDTGWMHGIRFPWWGWGGEWEWGWGYSFLLATLPSDFGKKYF